MWCAFHWEQKHGTDPKEPLVSKGEGRETKVTVNIAGSFAIDDI